MLRRPVPPAIAFISIAVLALNLVDVGFTLHHLELGAIELNPLMRELLERSPLHFVLGKHLMVGTGIVAVAGHCSFWLAAAALRLVVLPAYGLTAIYQVTLLGVAGLLRPRRVPRNGRRMLRRARRESALQECRSLRPDGRSRTAR